MIMLEVEVETEIIGEEKSPGLDPIPVQVLIMTV